MGAMNSNSSSSSNSSTLPSIDVTGQLGEKGLLNSVGAHHCFLNVVIQSLWHLGAFRARFIAADPAHVHDYVDVAKDGDSQSENERKDDDGLMDARNTCISCALKTIFIHYNFSELPILPPDMLRAALASLPGNDKLKFAMFEMGDASEALEVILTWLHCCSSMRSYPSGADVACAPPCTAHAVFATHIADVKTCDRCRATGDPVVSNNFFYTIYVQELIDTRQSLKSNDYAVLLKGMYASAAFKCPSDSACTGIAHTQRHLLTFPLVTVHMLIWRPDPTRDEIQHVLDMLPLSFNMAAALTCPQQQQQQQNDTIYDFVGFILYYGKHYLSIFYSDSFKCFLMFDDKRVCKIGDWSAVKQRCARGKLQPTVVFFQRRGTQTNNNKNNSNNNVRIDAEFPLDGIQQAREVAQQLDSRQQQPSQQRPAQQQTHSAPPPTYPSTPVRTQPAPPVPTHSYPGHVPYQYAHHPLAPTTIFPVQPPPPPHAQFAPPYNAQYSHNAPMHAPSNPGIFGAPHQPPTVLNDYFPRPLRPLPLPPQPQPQPSHPLAPPPAYSELDTKEQSEIWEDSDLLDISSIDPQLLSPSAAAGASWTCSACHFRNAPLNTKCAMCDRENNTNALAQQGMASSPMPSAPSAPACPSTSSSISSPQPMVCPSCHQHIMVPFIQCRKPECMNVAKTKRR